VRRWSRHISVSGWSYNFPDSSRSFAHPELIVSSRMALNRFTLTPKPGSVFWFVYFLRVANHFSLERQALGLVRLFNFRKITMNLCTSARIFGFLFEHLVLVLSIIHFRNVFCTRFFRVLIPLFYPALLNFFSSITSIPTRIRCIRDATSASDRIGGWCFFSEFFWFVVEGICKTRINRAQKRPEN